MAYTSLYRRFRPDTFEKVIGQDHIVKTLVNQIKNNNVGHAYLFTGTRGTGKTSVAKIFAKAVNCTNNTTGSPCGVCDVCQQLSSQTNFDILEIDAASNNSVEQIRDLTDKINFPPTVGKFKVYIVDEVHMLSKSAFNALLKTLEEPPQHAIFVLATTEVHQIPATILSRCLRFDFRLVSTTELVSHLENVYRQVGATFEKEALQMIATTGNGSVRDTLSVADMCLSFCGGKITYGGVLEVLGASDPQKMFELADAMLSGDIGATLELIAKLCDLGKNVRTMSKDLTTIFRNILFVKYCSNAKTILELPDEIFYTLENFAEVANNARLLFAITTLNGLEAQFRNSAQHRIVFEVGAVKIATSIWNDSSENGGNLGQKVQEIETRLKKIETTGLSANKESTSQKKNLNEKQVVEKKERPNYTAKQLWNFVLASLNNEKNEFGETTNKLLVITAMDGIPEIDGNLLIVRFQSEHLINIMMQKQNLDKLNHALSDISELRLKFEPAVILDDDNKINYLMTMFGEDLKILQ